MGGVEKHRLGQPDLYSGEGICNGYLRENRIPCDPRLRTPPPGPRQTHSLFDVSTVAREWTPHFGRGFPPKWRLREFVRLAISESRSCNDHTTRAYRRSAERNSPSIPFRLGNRCHCEPNLCESRRPKDSITHRVLSHYIGFRRGPFI